MKRLRSASFLALCGLLIWLLADSTALRSAAVEALDLCARSVIPALFPFLVVSSLLIALGFGESVGPKLARLMTPLYRLPGCAAAAVVLGLVGGYPIGARTAAQLHREGLLTLDEAERLLTFCNNSNPVFLLSVLGQGVFGSPRAGLTLWLIHVGSALIAGLLFRGRGKKAVRRSVPRSVAVRTVRFSSAFVTAVREGAMSMVGICGFVVFFYVLSSPFGHLEGLFGTAVIGALELFSLTPRLTADFSGFVLASACAGWGGVSVLCQTAAVLEGSGLSMGSCVKGKAVQAALSALLAALLWPGV